MLKSLTARNDRGTETSDRARSDRGTETSDRARNDRGTETSDRARNDRGDRLLTELEMTGGHPSDWFSLTHV